MFEFMGFDELQVGQRLKVKGEPNEDGKFVALEVSLKSPADHSEIEGVIQHVDFENSVIRILNKDIELAPDIVIKDLQRNVITLAELNEGDMVKLKGHYDSNDGFVPEKVKMKDSMGFVVEELQGNIESIEHGQKSFKMIGFEVAVTEKTEIEGF